MSQYKLTWEGDLKVIRICSGVWLAGASLLACRGCSRRLRYGPPAGSPAKRQGDETRGVFFTICHNDRKRVQANGFHGTKTTGRLYTRSILVPQYCIKRTLTLTAIAILFLSCVCWGDKQLLSITITISTKQNTIIE
jgi:hypothetical protein